MVEVFAFEKGRLIAHEGFEPADAAGLILFAEEALAGHVAVALSGGEGADEARIVTAYLRRRHANIEAARLRDPKDLVNAVVRVVQRAAEADETLGA
jgi:hypothetical protein